MNTTGLVTRVRQTARAHQRRRLGVAVVAVSALSQAEFEADLTLDLEGRITDCTPAAARLLACNADSLTGQAIKTVIAQLPLAPDTPGYNLAYAVFHGRDGGWVRRVARLQNGQKIAVEVALGSTYWQGEHSITLSLRSAPCIN